MNLPVTSPILRNTRKAMKDMMIDLTTGAGGPRIDYLNPPGDPGLYGPDSMVWKVHGDFPSMLAGGVSALLMQALHPLALAGVWDHSNFREDILGRLRRTANFVAGTTFASKQDAEMLIDMVKRIHLNITGQTEDGRAYAASDPALLTWVHVGEVYSFQRGFQTYNRRLTHAELDQYYRETALVAEMLGAENVPVSTTQVSEYFEAMRGELVYSERSKAVFALLLDAPAPARGLKPAVGLFMRSGMDLLPHWAQQMMGLDRNQLTRRLTTRPIMKQAAKALRWGQYDGAAVRARQRMAKG